MKRTLILMLLIVSILLIGCEQETNVYEELEYITTVETKSGVAFQFKSGNGNLFTFYSEEYFELEKDVKYNVEVTVEDWDTHGDFIERVEKSK